MLHKNFLIKSKIIKIIYFFRKNHYYLLYMHSTPPWYSVKKIIFLTHQSLKLNKKFINISEGIFLEASWKFSSQWWRIFWWSPENIKISAQLWRKYSWRITRKIIFKILGFFYICFLEASWKHFSQLWRIFLVVHLKTFSSA